MSRSLISGSTRSEGGVLIPSRSSVAAVGRLVLLVALACVSLGVLAGSASAGHVGVGVFANTGAGNGGSGSGQGELLNPGRAVVHQATGNLLVADTGNDRVQVFAPDGTSGVYLAEFGSGTLDGPTGLAVDEDTGAVYVSDTANTRVVRYETDGQPTPTYTLDAGFASPAAGGALAFDQTANELVVADPADNMVKRFDTTGGAVGTSFDGSTSPAAFTGLLDVAVDSTGDVLVVDSSRSPLDDVEWVTGFPTGSGSRVERFDSTGQWEAAIGPVDGPGSVAVDPDGDRVVVAGRFHAWNSGSNPNLYVFAPDGTPVSESEFNAFYAITPGLAPVGGGSSLLYAVTKDPYGDIYGPTAVHVLEYVDPPAVDVQPASDVTTDAATLNATVNPNDQDASYHFEYKLDTASDWTQTDPQPLPAGTSPVPVDTDIDGLAPNRAYAYRIVASNIGGQTTSSETSFTTDPVPPAVAPLGATAVKTDSAVLQAKVNPHGQTTSYHFQWGTTASYGQTTTPADAGDSHQATTVQTKITGLTPGTTYHYRLVATNATGETEGPDRTVTAAAATTADNCPNAAIRAQQHSTYLANCRAYEQVSPPDKNGNPVVYTAGIGAGLTAGSADGEVAAFSSYGSFAGATHGLSTTYRSVRSETGWATVPASPPPTMPDPHLFGTRGSAWMFASADLSTALYFTEDFHDPSDQNGWPDAYVNRFGAAPELVSRGNGDERLPPRFVVSDLALSGDGSAAVFAPFSAHLQEGAHMVPEDAGRVAGVDFYARERGVTHLVNVAPGGGLASTCGSKLGTGGSASVSGQNVISFDGSHIVFTTPNNFFGSVDASCLEPSQLYVRIDNERTLHVSASQRTTPDPDGTRPATFQGASVDGSVVFFSSSEMLTDDAPAEGGIYRYDTVSEDLELVDGAHNGPGHSAALATVSDDGSHVYFVSDAQLTPQASAGRMNLYVSANGEVAWIGAGVVAASAGLLRDDVADLFEKRQIYAAPDGEHVVFATRAQLTDAEHSEPDTGEPYRAVYLYSESSGSLVCVSCDPAGQRPAGSDPSSDAGISINFNLRHRRAMSDDGQRLVFMTGDRLVSQDVNAEIDVYEFSDGRLSLVSSGQSGNESLLVDMSRDGRSVFFTTVDSLVGQDLDAGDKDMYVARVNGGFVGQQRPEESPRCLGDGCQPSAEAERRLSPGTRSGGGRGDVRSGRAVRSVRLAAVAPASSRRLARSGRLRVRVRVRGGGRLSLRLTASVDGRRRVLAVASRRVSSTRTVAVTLRVRGKAARRWLAKAGAVNVEARLSGVSSPSKRKLRLTTGKGGR